MEENKGWGSSLLNESKKEDWKDRIERKSIDLILETNHENDE